MRKIAPCSTAPGLRLPYAAALVLAWVLLLGRLNLSPPFLQLVWAVAETQPCSLHEVVQQLMDWLDGTAFLIRRHRFLRILQTHGLRFERGGMFFLFFLCVCL